MTLLPMVVGTAAAVTTVVATPLVIRWADRRGLRSHPGERDIHTRPVPRLGGIAIVLGTLVGLGSALALSFLLGDGLVEAPSEHIVLGVVLGGLIAFGAGLVDDLKGLRPGQKLIAQVAAALLVYALGFRIDHITWGAGDLFLGWASLPITVLWVVGLTNAYNLVDGMDGLATGMGLVAFAATTAAAALLGNAQVVVLSSILLGALLGFLPYNFNPARIFLGDSGSLFVGFNLAVLSMHGSMKSSTAVLVVVPLFALAIPLLDTLVSILRRWLRGLPVSQADAGHIHHRLLDRGLSHRDAVLLLYAVASGFATIGILLAFAPPTQVLVVSAFAAIASLAVILTGMRGLRYDEFLLAGKVLASGPRRVREVLRHKILATDVAAVLRAAQSVEEIEAVLGDSAPELGLVDLQICRSADADGFHTPSATMVPAWRLDFPVCDHSCPDPWILRLLAPISDEIRPNSAARVAHILGRALQEQHHLLAAECGRSTRVLRPPQPVANTLSA